MFNGMVAKLRSFDELRTLLKDEIAATYPKYPALPPGDDPRHNKTTWTVFKEKIDIGLDKDGETAAPTGE